MILRTPPPKKLRTDTKAAVEESSPAGQLLIYEDPPDAPDQPSDHLLCTYQCRQMVKSEFFDALSSAEKQARDYQSKWESLNDNFGKVEAERKQFREQFLYAEQELAAAKGREQALQEQLLKEVNDSKERFKKQIQSYSELEVKLQNEANLRKKAEFSAASSQEKANTLEGQLNRLSESMEREKKSLQAELAQLKRESRHSLSRKCAELEKVGSRATNAEKESELLKEQMEVLRKHLNECLHQKSEAEKKLATLTFQEPNSTDASILVKHLQEELRNYESEVREARNLKLSYEQTELLREKLFEERSRRERAEAEMSKLQELQHNMKSLEDELSAWKLMMKDIPGVSSPDDIPAKFASLQKEVLDSTMRLGELNAHLKQKEVALDEAQLGKQSAEADAALAKEKSEEMVQEINRIQSMLSMVTEERDKLRSLLEEYKSTKNDTGGRRVADEALLQELQSSLANKEKCIKELESSLQVQKEINNRQREEIKLLGEKLNNEARRIKSLERESDRLRSEIALLEAKLGHGDFSSANTKVLRMVNTLAVDNEAKQTIEALRSELQKTKDKLKAFEELNNQSGDAVKSVDSHISEKIMQLKEQIATLEKREERYKTVFADRISVFRRACCELFGYKIVMDEHQRPNGIPVTRFTLQSIYAQNNEEKLEFEYESGNIAILPNAYSSQPDISQQVGIFIHKMNSIPAFTANLTVESFNRRTLS
ncbi:mitotic spindle checkpoint protein MAD1 isoform X2 [Punica granatum]|uniref:Mitotic spindle checkpoint protein MAD1 isoform X2 n=2 Tax=Punica granatum TaxID=22663 RepID=A0A6P8CM49_PUNGR|nr:mitotic spindle checkpoint protein MAD1 isoform X2 [Punica granatum]